MKPILFNTEMVRAILDGRKTVTRRVIKPQPKMQLVYICMGNNHGKWIYPPPNCVEQSGWDKKYRRVKGLTAEDDAALWTPPCHTDDILYVRETWAEVETVYGAPYFIYRADDKNGLHSSRQNFERWRPSIHMPKEAARLFLRVKGVRVERLLAPFFASGATIMELRKEGVAIPEECAECIKNYGNPCCIDGDEDSECGILDEVRADFSDLWDSTVKKSDLDKYGWAANPLVWVIAFERISKEEARENA